MALAAPWSSRLSSMKPRLQLQHAANWLVQSHIHSRPLGAHMPGDVKCARTTTSSSCSSSSWCLVLPWAASSALALPTCGDNAELSYLSNVETLASTSGLSESESEQDPGTVHGPAAAAPGKDSDSDAESDSTPIPCHPRRFVSLSAVVAPWQQLLQIKERQIFYAEAEINFCQSIAKKECDDVKKALKGPRRFKCLPSGHGPLHTPHTQREVS